MISGRLSAPRLSRASASTWARRLSFPIFTAAVQYIRTVSAPFGAHSDQEWSTLTEHVTRRQADGSYRMAYDPAIAVPFNAAVSDKDIELWP